jgi:hypothetical protein
MDQLQEQQKNMMVQLGQILPGLNTARYLAGAGTQTAGLAFGGYSSNYYRSNRRI